MAGHGSPESLLFRAVSDPRSKFQSAFATGQAQEFYQRFVLEVPVYFSAIAAIQAATEVAAFYPTDIDLRASVTNAWSLLIKVCSLAIPVLEIRAQQVLRIIR